MALLLKRKALDAEMVWHTFFYWIDHYYAALEPYIEERQQKDPLVWKDFVGLVHRMRRIQNKRLGVSAARHMSSEEISRFLTEEQAEA